MSYNSSVGGDLLSKDGRIILTTTRARGNHDFSSYLLDENNKVSELTPSFSLMTGILSLK